MVWSIIRSGSELGHNFTLGIGVKSPFGTLAQQTEICKTPSDEDARSMVMHHHSTEVGYNVQTVVDDQHHLIVEHEVTNDPTDHAHLADMALRAKATLGVEQLTVVADMG